MLLVDKISLATVRFSFVKEITFLSGFICRLVRLSISRIPRIARNLGMKFYGILYGVDLRTRNDHFDSGVESDSDQIPDRVFTFFSTSRDTFTVNCYRKSRYYGACRLELAAIMPCR